MRHNLTLDVKGSRPHRAAAASFHHLGHEVLQSAYRHHILEENMAFPFDALADALAIFTVADELDSKRDVVFLRPGDQLLQSHPLQDAARQPAAQKPSFPGHDRGPTLDRLHRGIEAREPDGVEEDVGPIEQSVKRRTAQPVNEDHMLVDVQAISAENDFESLS